MSRPVAESADSLPTVTWRLTLGEPAGFDGSGVYAFAEVEGHSFTADGHLLLIDAPELEGPEPVEQLRRAVGFHEWLDLEGVVPIRAIEPHTDRLAVVSEARQGQPLSRLVGAVPTPPRSAGEMVSVLAEMLHDLHTQTAPGEIKGAGLAHGGVDLDHVLLGRSGEVLLIGAGLAAPLRARGIQAVDLGFLAPEVRGGPRASASADVYAATVLLLTCLLGRPPEPFPSSSQPHAEAVETALAELGSLDPEVAQLIREGLSFDPQARPAASELGVRLRGLLQRTGGRWLSAWASDVVARQPHFRPIPREEELAPETTESRRPSSAVVADGNLRPLTRVGGPGESPSRRRVLLTGLGAVGAGALLFIIIFFSVEPLTRWWVAIYGPMETEDVLTDMAGPPRMRNPSGSGWASGGSAGRGWTWRGCDAGCAGKRAASDGGSVAVIAPEAEAARDTTEAQSGRTGAALALRAGHRSGTGRCAEGPSGRGRGAGGRASAAPPCLLSPSSRRCGSSKSPSDRTGKRSAGISRWSPSRWASHGRRDPRGLRERRERGRKAEGVPGGGLGRCDVRIRSVGDEARGTFRPEGSGDFICRVEFADELRCYPD